MGQHVITITRRNRNIGYGWTTDTVQHRTASGGSFLGVDRPDRPCVIGSIETARRERQQVSRMLGSTYVGEALFVGGRRVVEPSMREVLMDIDDRGEARVIVEDQPQ